MKDLAFVLLLLVALGGAWFVLGGPERGISPGLFLQPPVGTSGDAYGRLDFTSASERFAAVKKELEEAARLGKLSPFRGKISIESSSSGAEEKDPNREYVILRASTGNAGSVVISGWRLSTIDGQSATIGNGVRLFESGRVPLEEPIALSPGGRAVVTTGRSPVGVSFTLNMCTGYLEQFQDFNPSLPRRCPSPSSVLEGAIELRDFDQACVDFIKRMPSCQMNVAEIPTRFKDSCVNFISEEFTYTGCLKRFRSDQNFFEKEWRVFLGLSSELWKQERDVVRLTDAEGNTVDVFSY